MAAWPVRRSMIRTSRRWLFRASSNSSSTRQGRPANRSVRAMPNRRCQGMGASRGIRNRLASGARQDWNDRDEAHTPDTGRGERRDGRGVPSGRWEWSRRSAALPRWDRGDKARPVRRQVLEDAGLEVVGHGRWAGADTLPPYLVVPGWAGAGWRWRSSKIEPDDNCIGPGVVVQGRAASFMRWGWWNRSAFHPTYRQILRL